MARDNYDYYARRAQQEEDAASNAACTAARERHEELAEAYRLRCSLIVALRKPAGSATVIDHPPKAHRAIVGGKSSVLAASQTAAPSTLCHA